MKQILIASILVFAGNLLADSVTSATGSFQAFPAGFTSSTPSWIGAQSLPATTGSPFWNNPSDDAGAGGSHMMNIGYVLSDSGGLAGTTSVLGSDTVAEDFMTAGGGDPTAFSFASTGIAFNMSLLFAQSSLNTGSAAFGTVFGEYAGNTYTPIYTVGDTSSPTDKEHFQPTTAGNSYGFYATVCYAVNSCETYTTGDGNSGSVGGAAAWNHFALFQLSSGSYVIGFTAADAMEGESLGDFNDVVIELQAIPEPGTIGIMAIGLAGLGFLARRARLT